MKSTNKKRNQMVQTIILLAVASVLCFGVGLYNFLEAQVHRAEVVTEQQTLDASEQRLSYLQTLAAEEEKTREAIENCQLLLPADVNQDEVFLTVQELCDRHGVSVSQMLFQEIQAQDDVQELPLSITLQGEYGSVMALLEELTTGERLTLLDTISIQSQLAAKGIVAAQATAEIYFQQ